MNNNKEKDKYYGILLLGKDIFNLQININDF